jgi:hypothetical protein
MRKHAHVCGQLGICLASSTQHDALRWLHGCALFYGWAALMSEHAMSGFSLTWTCWPCLAWSCFGWRCTARWSQVFLWTYVFIAGSETAGLYMSWIWWDPVSVSQSGCTDSQTHQWCPCCATPHPCPHLASSVLTILPILLGVSPGLWTQHFTCVRQAIFGQSHTSGPCAAASLCALTYAAANDVKHLGEGWSYWLRASHPVNSICSIHLPIWNRMSYLVTHILNVSPLLLCVGTATLTMRRACLHWYGLRAELHWYSPRAGLHWGCGHKVIWSPHWDPADCCEHLISIFWGRDRTWGLCVSPFHSSMASMPVCVPFDFHFTFSSSHFTSSRILTFLCFVSFTKYFIEIATLPRIKKFKIQNMYFKSCVLYHMLSEVCILSMALSQTLGSSNPPASAILTAAPLHPVYLVCVLAFFTCKLSRANPLYCFSLSKISYV